MCVAAGTNAATSRPVAITCLCLQMKELVTRVQNDEAIAALKSSESTSDFVAVRGWGTLYAAAACDALVLTLYVQFRIQELVDSSLQSEQEATIRRLTEEIAGFHVRSATVDSELSRLQSDNGVCAIMFNIMCCMGNCDVWLCADVRVAAERLLSAVVNLRTVAQQAEDKAAVRLPLPSSHKIYCVVLVCGITHTVP